MASIVVASRQPPVYYDGTVKCLLWAKLLRLLFSDEFITSDEKDREYCTLGPFLTVNPLCFFKILQNSKFDLHYLSFPIVTGRQ